MPEHIDILRRGRTPCSTHKKTRSHERHRAIEICMYRREEAVRTKLFCSGWLVAEVTCKGALRALAGS